MPTVRKFVGMPVLGEGVVAAECVGNHLEFPMGRNICVFFSICLGRNKRISTGSS